MQFENRTNSEVKHLSCVRYIVKNAFCQLVKTIYSRVPLTVVSFRAVPKQESWGLSAMEFTFAAQA